MHLSIAGLKTVAAAGGVLLVLCALTGCKPPYITKTERFAKHVKAVVDPAELQSWATNFLAEVGKTNTAPGILELNPTETETPGVLRPISTEQTPTILVCGIEKGLVSSNSCISLMYGGGFGHWGLTIGLPTLVATNTDEEYYLQWRPGIYFWSGQ